MNQNRYQLFLRRIWVILYDYYFLHGMVHVYAKIGQSSFFLIWAIATGILTGCAIVLIRLIAGSLEEVFLFHNYPVSLTPILIFAPLAGIAVSCAIKSWLSHSNSSADMTLLIQSIRERNPKLIKLETLSHIFASSLTVGTGGSAGLTTPSVLTGASIGGNIGRMLHIAPDKSIRLMSCGTAAGIAAIFGSPIAGVLFAVEVLLPQMSIGTLVPVLLAAASATVIAQITLGSMPFFHMPVHAWAVETIPLYAVLGVFCALTGIYMIRTNYALSEKLMRWFPKTGRRMLAGGFLVSVLILLLPTLSGEGIFFIQEPLREHTLNGAPISFLGSLGVSQTASVLLLAGMLVLIKIIATSVTLACGGSGGFFAPSLFTGAFAGFLLERFFHLFHWQKTDDANFIALGMCGVFTSTFHAPLTGIFLVVEMTGSYALMIPLIVVGAISYFITVFFEDSSIYTRDPHAYDDAYAPESNPDDPETIDFLVNRNFTPISAENTPDWKSIIASADGNDFPVLDKNGILLGIVRRNLVSDSETAIFDLASLITHPLGVVKTTDSPLLVRAAMKIFSLDQLPVTDSRRRFAGFISKDKIG